MSHSSASSDQTQPPPPIFFHSLFLQFCGKGFTDERWFQGHMREHTGEKPYTCDVCGTGFSSKPQLKSHVALRHSDATSASAASQQRREFTCSVCDKAFRTKDKLEYHARAHSDKTYCKCETCGKEFKYATSLARHMLYHSESRPHVCTICDKSYKVKNDLTTHLKKAHPRAQESQSQQQQQQPRSEQQQSQQPQLLKKEEMTTTTTTARLTNVVDNATTSLTSDQILLTTSDEELHFSASLVAAAAGMSVNASGGLDDDVDDPSGPTAGQGQVVEVHPSVALIDAKYQPMTSLHLTQEQPQYQQLQQPASLSQSQSHLLQQGSGSHNQQTLNVVNDGRLSNKLQAGSDISLATILTLPSSRLNQHQAHSQPLQPQLSTQDGLIETTPQVGAEQVVTTEESQEDSRADAGGSIADTHWNNHRSNSRKKF